MNTFNYELDFDADPKGLTFTFGGVEAVAQVETPCVLTTSTRDAFAGRLDRRGTLPSEADLEGYLNPQTGPFFIRDAKAGDSIAVHFQSIEPRFDFGVSALIPFFGSLTSTDLTATLQKPLPERVWRYEIDSVERTVAFVANDSDFEAKLPLDPMHGTVGVAPPKYEVHSSLTPGCWGGNMDTPEIRAGTTCYLGVNVDGAMFSFGDGHARQGEGETCGTAVETAMNSTVVLDVVPGYYTSWPRLENDNYIMSVGSARPLEDAFRIAHTDMVHWVHELTEMSIEDAYQFVSQVALTPVANVVDTTYSMVCKIEKKLLGNVSPYDGLHNRFRRS